MNMFKNFRLNGKGFARRVFKLISLLVIASAGAVLLAIYPLVSEARVAANGVLTISKGVSGLPAPIPTRNQGGAVLKICDIGENGVAEYTPFTFDIVVNGELRTIVLPVTVSAGDASHGGFCKFVAAPYSDTLIINGIPSFRPNSSVTVTQRATPKFRVSSITSTYGILTSVSPANRTATMSLGNGINDLTFTNARR